MCYLSLLSESETTQNQIKAPSFLLMSESNIYGKKNILYVYGLRIHIAISNLMPTPRRLELYSFKLMLFLVNLHR
jgi:hypothetical protein